MDVKFYKKNIFRLTFFICILMITFCGFEITAEEKINQKEEGKIEIEIDPKWVRMDTAVKEITGDKMKVTRTFADREPMDITIYFDSETKVVRGDEELKVSDIKAGDKVEVYYQKKWLGDFMKRLGRVVKIKNGPKKMEEKDEQDKK